MTSTKQALFSTLAAALPLGLAALVDLRSGRLPNKLLLLALLTGGAVQCLAGGLETMPVQMAFALLAFGGLLGFRHFAGGHFGMGDVKMLGVCAVFLPPLTWAGMLLGACLLAMAWFVARSIAPPCRGPESEEAGRPRRLPFGPFIWLSFMAAGLLGQCQGAIAPLWGLPS
jgi:Flp pilus assembly protein protease CpaA